MIRYLQFWLVVVTAWMIVTGCSPKSYVVLMDSPDGTTGKVAVSSAQGNVLLAKSRTGIDLDGSSDVPFSVDESQIQKDFGEAMAARPPLPTSLMLYYKQGGTELTESSRVLIPALLKMVRMHPAPDISVIGHTDTMGEDDFNERVGLERAQSVADIIRGELKKERKMKEEDIHITVVSHGERNLLIATPDNTPEPKNRRVEITVR